MLHTIPPTAPMIANAMPMCAASILKLATPGGDPNRNSGCTISTTPVKDITQDKISIDEKDPVEMNVTAQQAPIGARKLSTVASARGRYIRETDS